MAVKRKIDGRKVSSSAEPRPNILFRCIRPGMGCGFRGHRDVASLEQKPTEVACQHERIGSCPYRVDKICRTDQREGGSSPFGQCNGSVTYSETRRHSLVLPLQGDEDSAFVAKAKSDTSIDKVCSRETKYKGRLAQLQEASDLYGMYFAPHGMSTNVEVLGNSAGRPICHSQEQQTSNLLFFSSGLQAWATDAMVQNWENLDVYAFPPFKIVREVLNKLGTYKNIRMTLIAPFWPSRE